MLARKRLWRQARVAGWNSPKMEQYIAQLEGIPPNWKMEQVIACYGKPSEIPTHVTRGKVFPVSAYLSYSSLYMPGGLAYFILQRIMYPWRRPSIVINSDSKLQGTGDGYTEIKNMSAEKKEQWLFIKPKDENNVPIPLEDIEGFLSALQNLAALQMAKIACAFTQHEVTMCMFLNLLWEGMATIAHSALETIQELRERFQVFSCHEVRRITFG